MITNGFSIVSSSIPDWLIWVYWCGGSGGLLQAARSWQF